MKSATLHILACLLEPQCLLRIHQKLNGSNGSLQFQFLRSTVKTFSVESVSQSTNSYTHYILLTQSNNKFICIFFMYISIFLQGHLEANLDISTKDAWTEIFVFFHKNLNITGSYSECLLKLEPHNLKQAFLTTGLNVK